MRTFYSGLAAAVIAMGALTACGSSSTGPDQAETSASISEGSAAALAAALAVGTEMSDEPTDGCPWLTEPSTEQVLTDTAAAWGTAATANSTTVSLDSFGANCTFHTSPDVTVTVKARLERPTSNGPTICFDSAGASHFDRHEGCEITVYLSTYETNGAGADKAVDDGTLDQTLAKIAPQFIALLTSNPVPTTIG